MPSNSISASHFHDEDKAREYLEAMRWANGVFCPHCGAVGESYRLTPKVKSEVEIKALKDAGKRVRAPRRGLWKCGGCRKQFTVTVKTIFEDSHIPLHKWLYAIHMLCSSKKGMSAHQLMRNLDLGSYKSAWFMAHRIRHAMSSDTPIEKLKGIVEFDETYVGGKRRNRHAHVVKAGDRAQDRLSPVADKAAVFSMLERGGRVRSQHIDKVNAKNLKAIISEVCEADAHLMSDTGVVRASKERKHSLVNHKADEYVRYEEGVCVTTNTVEGYFSILKRGVNGVYHHVSKKHLHRYLNEFDFRYNGRKVTDSERAQEALKGFEGKRLMYKDGGC